MLEGLEIGTHDLQLHKLVEAEMRNEKKKKYFEYDAKWVYVCASHGQTDMS
ncbi:hypothetical protein PDE_01292 [Penicillium oxalicum 114-2]|uniref:Uncharacterized protein n=1 Tax=Penicillium oxalicum (strain 114-2 / CGMCC 5302) TaxID=933388 RepID=S7ZCE3_PENO1|nr:hypothetical protein PDE_01292 [Penicillium oxalicum 114-2]